MDELERVENDAGGVVYRVTGFSGDNREEIVITPDRLSATVESFGREFECVRVRQEVR